MKSGVAAISVLVLGAAFAAPDCACAQSGPRIAPLRAADELVIDAFISDATWNELANTQSTKQLIDVRVAVGGYRSTSMLINSAGVQRDDNMADFRFPPGLR